MVVVVVVGANRLARNSISRHNIRYVLLLALWRRCVVVLVVTHRRRRPSSPSQVEVKTTSSSTTIIIRPKEPRPTSAPICWRTAHTLGHPATDRTTLWNSSVSALVLAKQQASKVSSENFNQLSDPTRFNCLIRNLSNG